MGEQAKVKETVKLYSKVWQLPTYRGIIIRMVAMALVSSSILAILEFIVNGSGQSLLTFFYYVVVLIVTTFLGSGILYALVRKEGSPLDARRTLGSVQFGIIFWYSLGTLGGIIDFILATNIEVKFWTLGMGLGYLAFAFLVTGLSDYHPVRNLVAAMMPALVWTIIISTLSSMGVMILTLSDYWVIIFVVVIVIGGIAVHHIFKSVSMPFERDLGINGPALLRAFGYDYLVENPEPLETLLTEISVVQDVPMELIVFRSGETLISVGVILYVHPGPFRDIGSSGLPSEIIRHIKTKYGVQAFILHGSCTHHQNLTNKEDYRIVFDEIDNLIGSAEVHEIASGLHWSDHGKFKVWTFFVGEDVLAITTSAPEFTDDISLEVGRAAAETARESAPGIRYVALSDAHNCIDHDAVSLMSGDPDEESYIEAVKDAIASNFGNPRGKVAIGVHQIVPDYIASKEGMGPGGITVIILEVNSVRNALVSIDGNNVEPGYRERIQETLLSMGFDTAEVTTTDTHVVNAISLSSKGYPPVGQYKPDEILESIKQATSRAEENLTQCEVGLAFGEAKGIRTFGEKGFDVLTQDVAEAAKIAKRTGIIAGGLAFIAYLVLSILA